MRQTLLVARVFAPGVARMLRLPAALLSGAVTHSPVRHGFAAGSLMTGLALLVGIWTGGRALLNNWIGAIDFPDAFVDGENYFPVELRDTRLYEPVERGLEIRIAEKLRTLRRKNAESSWKRYDD